MTQTYRKTLLAGAIAALLATPMIAAAEVTRDGAQATGTPQVEQQWRNDKTTDRTGTRDSADRPESSAQPQPKGPDTGEASLSELEEPVGYPTEEYTNGTQVSDNPLYSQSFDDLNGMDVVDSAGKDLGKVTGIVLSADRRSAQAVVSSGGFLGIGTREILVSFSDLKSMDGQLQMDTTQEAFKARSDFVTDSHIRLDGDRPILESIVEAAPIEPGYGSDQRSDTLPRGTVESERGATTPGRTTETR